MDLKWLMLNENSQIQNPTQYMIPFNDILEKAQWSWKERLPQKGEYVCMCVCVYVGTVPYFDIVLFTHLHAFVKNAE